MVTKIDENLAGMVNTKSVTCQSLETEFTYKMVTYFSGTFEFYDPISPQNSLLGQMVELVPSWSVGYVDPAIQTLYRTFTITNKTVYDFLMNDVETSYQCVITFDTINKIVNAYSTGNATTNTDIFLSFDNLLQSGKLSQLTDELVTAMYVYGDGTLDIHAVNPLGTSEIYNFDYYKTTNWMSQDLVNAITAWESVFVTQQPIYANYLTDFANANDQLLVDQGNLDNQNAAMDALVAVQKADIQAGQSLTAINSQIAAQQLVINAAISTVASDNVVINNILTNLENINDLVSFTTNFTPTQLSELNPFIIENTYQNKDFLTTDTMTNSEIQEQAQALYDQGVAVLAKVSQPRYEFSLDSSNFLFLNKFKPFIDQLAMGCIVTVDKGDGTIFEIVLLEIDFQYDDPTKFTMTMSNRVRMDGNKFVYSDLFNQVVSTSTSVNFNSNSWSNWVNEYKSDVTDFINSALNAANNEIISSSNQEITINQNGLRGKQYNSGTQTYDPHQVWLVNNMLAFTQDNWNTASLALGQITVGGNQVYGLISEKINKKILFNGSIFI